MFVSRQQLARISRQRSVLAAAAVATLAFVPPAIAGTPTYLMSSSSATYTHHRNTGFTDFPFTLKPTTSSNTSLWTHLFPGANGSQYSNAFAGIGAVSNPTTATFAAKAGTGVTQNDPLSNPVVHWDASKLTLSFTGYWSTTSQFGPSATNYFSMAYGGVNGGSASVNISVDFSIGTTLQNPTVFRSVRSGTLPLGATVKTFTSSALINAGTHGGIGAISAGRFIKASGSIVFSADNDASACNVMLTNMDCGSAPPTANFQFDTSQTMDWNTNGNWQPNAATTDFDVNGSDDIRTAPNAAGVRARFGNRGLTSVGPRTVSLSSAVTIGTLDIDDDDAYTFTGSALTFQVQQGDAVIRTGNSSGATAAADQISTPVMLASSVTVQTEAQPLGEGRGVTAGSNLIMDGQIAGAGSTQGLTKIGDASLTLSGNNSYGGGTSARGGYLDADVTSSLGTGTVLADDGQLNYNAPNAAAPGIVSNAQNNGQVNLGILTTTEKFAVHDLGAISGSDAELSTLNVQPGGNLSVDTGAMIAHESFDFGPINNPAGLFDAGASAYIFGIAADFTAPDTQSVTVGSNSGTIWKGFGGDRGNRVYGGDPNSGSVTLTAAGTTELVSLHNSLTINARLQNSGPSSIIKRGGGTVIINNVFNPYAGPITIQSGTLAVNGGLNNVTNLIINPGGTLTTRAAGVLTASTILLSGGQAYFNGGDVHVNQLIPLAGELHQTAGGLTIGTQLTTSAGVLAQFSGGTCLINGNMTNNGTLVVDGGSVSMQVLSGPSSSGVFVSDGTLTANAASALSGQSVIDGGRVTFNNNLSVPSTGVLKYNGGTLTVANTLTVNGGSLLIGAGADGLLKVGNAATPAGGKIDLNDSDMMLTGSSYGAVASLVSSGRNGGAWTGSGITSTAARNAAPANTTLGVLKGSEYLAAGNTTFDGQTVLANSVLVKYTYYGDTDFNGVVDFDDYSHTDFGFNTNSTGWFNGDFDYNGIVDFDDYSLIDFAFNTQSASLRPAMQFLRGEPVDPDQMNDTPALRMVRDHFAQFGQPYADAFLSAVPEPSVSALGLVIMGAIFRRSRRTN